MEGGSSGQYITLTLNDTNQHFKRVCSVEYGDELMAPKDCNVSNWTNDTPCPNHCGYPGGTIQMTRSVKDGSYGGRKCSPQELVTTEAKTCQRGPQCPPPPQPPQPQPLQQPSVWGTLEAVGHSHLKVGWVMNGGRHDVSYTADMNIRSVYGHVIQKPEPFSEHASTNGSIKLSEWVDLITMYSTLHCEIIITVLSVLQPVKK